MGLFHRNENEANFAGGSKNVMESIQRQNDTGTLIYLDSRQDFNTNSVITVAPNEQVIFIKNGEIYGVLTNGRNEVKTENIAILSRIRNMLTGGMSTFTCQVYHVQTNEQKVDWGTSTPIEIQDFFLGGGAIGVPTLIRGAAALRIRFNINEDDEACVKTFMRLMGDKTTYTVTDLASMFEAELCQKISSVVGKTLENISRQCSINAISSYLEDFSNALKPSFMSAFADYGIELVNFSFYNLNIDETELRIKYLDRLIAKGHTGNYNQAVLQEVLQKMAENPNAGGVAGAAMGMGVGVGAGVTIGSTIWKDAFGDPGGNIEPPKPTGFGGGGRFGTGGATQQQQTAQPDPMESLSKMKQLLDAGLIKQEQYDAKVAEIMSRL